MSIGARNVPRPSGVSLLFHEALIDRLDAGDLDLPELDENAARVVALTARPDSDAHEAAVSLKACPELADRVVWIAGSALYAPVAPIETIDQAAQRLGMRAVGELALACMLRTELYEPLFSTARDVQQLWRQAAVMGVYAQRLSRMRRGASEASILSGILADVGKPLVISLLAELEKALGQELTRGASSTLVEALHVAVGVALVKSWGLPRSVLLSVAFHHAFERAPEGNEEAAIACLADTLTRRVLAAGGGQHEAIEELPVVAALRLSEEEIDELLADTDEIVAAASVF